MEKLADINFGLQTGFGPLGLEGVTSLFYTNSILRLSRVLSIVIGLLSVIASVWFLLKIILAGIAIISAGGDKGKVADARTSITNGLIGLIVVLLSTVIIGFLGTIFDIEFLDLASLVTSLRNN